MKVRLTELESVIKKALKDAGYKDDEAAIISNVLLYAQLRGNNQGITKIASGGIPKAADVEPYKVVSQNKCGALVSGGHSMVATHSAVKLAVQLAKEHGVGIVGSNHRFTSSGAIGFFARQIADAGYIGLTCVGAPPMVAPTGSAEPKLGTNPFSYGFPTNGESVVFDTTTAAMAYFGVVEAKIKSETLPKGTGYDKDGRPTADPASILEGGSIATFAGHKGYGLSLLIQMLGGPFVDASFVGVDKEKGVGTFVLAIDPGLLVNKEAFLKQASELTKQIKTAKPLPGQEVLLPGERGDHLAKQAADSGELEIADAIWNELKSFVAKP